MDLIKAIEEKQVAEQKVLTAKQELEKSREYANVYLEGYFNNLGYRIDLVGIKQNKTYDIFEVKPYPSATECIREALGQILHYYHLLVLEKGKNKIGKLVIVGPAELNDNDSNFLKTIIHQWGFSVNRFFEKR